jgi:hypothetical protein
VVVSWIWCCVNSTRRYRTVHVYGSEFDFDLSALSVGPIIEKPRLHCACCVKIIYTKRIPRYGIVRYHTSTYFYQHVRCDL